MAVDVVRVGRKLSVVLLKLSLFLVVFYVTFYCVLSVLTGAFSVVYDASLPFNYKLCCFGSNTHLVVVLSLELTCVLCALLFISIESSRLWDYALTVGVIHFMAACIIIREPPDNWQWWLAYVGGVLVMVAGGQATAVLLKVVRNKWTSLRHQD